LKAVWFRGRSATLAQAILPEPGSKSEPGSDRCVGPLAQGVLANAGSGKCSSRADHAGGLVTCTRRGVSQ
jgi:hypothetical protein